MLEKLKNLNVDRLDIEEAVALATWGRATQNGYTHYQVPAPKWLGDAIDTLDVEINRRRREMLLARKAELEANLTQLRTREERKADAQSELAALNDALGIK